MDALFNLLVLMSALSVAAERLANVIKLRTPSLRKGLGDARDRERRIATLAMLVSVGLALVIKADLFQILAHLDAPSGTLGWHRHAPFSVISVFSAICGSVFCGICVSCGSKFWHDLLDVIGALRAGLREVRP